MSVTPIESPPVWLPYLDMDTDVIPYMNAGNLTGMETQLQLALDFSCTWVQQYLSRPISVTQITEYLDGWTGLDGSYIMLRYSPIVQVISLDEYWGISGVHHLSEQTPQDQSAQDSYQVDYRTGRIIRTFPGLVPRPFFPGSRNLIVNYTAGYQTVPFDVKIATLEMLKYWYRQTFDPRATASRSSYDVDSGAQLWPGVPNRVVDLLAPYRQVLL